MAGLTGFDSLQLLSNSTIHQVYRATRQSDGAPVIIKVLDTLECSDEDVARLRHEFRLLQDHKQPRLVKALDCTRTDHLEVLVLQDDNAGDLAALLNQQKLALPVLMELMVSIVRAVGQSHQLGIVHRDVNPANLIVIHEVDGHLGVKLIDFGLAVQRKDVLGDLGQVDGLVGSLSYLAPEQTGKMNRQMDARADFYAMGITFYEMLVGHTPFQSVDKHELIHAHIAKRPIPPHELDKTIPLPISNIVMKLLAKNPESRYLCAPGIERDLERCQKEWHEGVLETAQWPLGQQDISPQLVIPEQLYGREQELRQLFRAFSKVRQGGKTLLLLSGDAGVGKTSLVNELYKPVLDNNAYLVFGKYDQLRRDVPYSGLILALRQWIRQLLAENEQKLLYWKSVLLKALGSNGAMLTDLVPELEQIIGEQPALKKMDPIQHQLLFNLIFEQFVAAIARKQHSFVLVLDDLQWADSASFSLLESVLASSDITNLMVVGIYRQKDVDSLHPLTLCVDAAGKRGCNIDRIELVPLQLESLWQLVVDVLHCEEKTAAGLAAILLHKTEGNPYFVEEFLSSLVAESLIRFDYEQGAWYVDLVGCEAYHETRNVLEFIAGRLQQCPPHYLFVLQAAACEGIEFQIETVLSMSGVHKSQILGAIQYGVDIQLIKPIGEAYLSLQYLDDAAWIMRHQPRYRFIHDHVLETVYESCLPSVRCEVHRLLGQKLLSGTDLARQSEAIFSIVRHLNYSADQLLGSADRIQLLKLNKLAAEKAVASTAFENGRQYLNIAQNLFSESMWQSDYLFARELWLLMMEVAYLTEDYAALDQYLNTFELHCRERADSLPFYHIKMHALHRQGNVQDAIELGLAKLSYVDESMPSNPGSVKVVVELLKTKLYLANRMRGRGLTYLLEEQVLKVVDPRTLQSATHLYEIGAYAFLARRNLFSCLVFRGVRDLFRGGATKGSSGALAAYGVVHCSVLNQIDTGYQYGKFSLRLAEALQHDASIISATQVFNGFIRHWKEPLRESLPSLLWVHRRSMEMAELDYAAHGANVYLIHCFFGGHELDGVASDAEKYHRTLTRVGLKNLSLYSALFRQLALNLMGMSQDPYVLEGSLYAPNPEQLKEIEKSDPTLLLYYHLSSLYLGVILQRDEGLDLHVAAILRYRKVSAGIYAISVFYCLHGVLCARRVVQGSMGRHKGISVLLRYQRMMTPWSTHCPDNFANKLSLLQGCADLMSRNYSRAQLRFEQSAREARMQGFVQEAALASEMCALSAMKAGLLLASGAYLQQAAILYRQWGAKEKLVLMKETPLVNQRGLTAATVPMQSYTHASRSLSHVDRDLDLAALRLALKAISEEKVHTRLIEKTILAATQFAAAQKAILLLSKGDGLVIEATNTSEMAAPTIMQSIALGQDSSLLCDAVANYVARTGKSLVINDAQQLQESLPGLHKSPYVLLNRVRSVMVIPLIEGAQQQSYLVGMLYLENNLAPASFTEGMIEALEIIGLSAAGRLELSRKAVTDGLTGLFNHDYFQQHLREQIELARRRNNHFSLLLMDIDHFKRFNDTWGHQAGDAVLKEVALLLQRHARTTDVVARYGGEEMALILPETAEEEAVALAEKIRLKIEEAVVHYEGQELRVTISVGVSSFGVGCEHPEKLIKAADEALYGCKDAGRNQVMAASMLSGKR